MYQEFHLSSSESQPKKQRGRSLNDHGGFQTLNILATSQEKHELQHKYQLFLQFYESCKNLPIDFLYLKEYFNIPFEECPSDSEIVKIQKKLYSRRFSQNEKKSWGQDEKKVLVWVIGKYVTMTQKNCRFLNGDDFNEISKYLFRRNVENVKQKWLSMHKTSLITQPFTYEEDQQLSQLYEKYKNEDSRWKLIAAEMNNLNSIYRTSKQLRERWINYLDPTLVKIKDPWTDREDLELIYQIQQKGKKWTEIAKQLKRNENQVKNRFNCLLKREDIEDDLNKLIDKILWRISKQPTEPAMQQEKLQTTNTHNNSLLLAIGNIEYLSREETQELSPCMVNLRTNHIYFAPHNLVQEFLYYQQQEVKDDFEKIRREMEKFEPLPYHFIPSLSIISEEYQFQPQQPHRPVHSFSEMPNFDSSIPLQSDFKSLRHPLHSLTSTTLHQKYFKYRTDLNFPRTLHQLPWQSLPQLVMC